VSAAPVIDLALEASAGAFTLDVAFTTGETVALLGASGAGKTLTLRALAGLLRPRTGRIAIGGRVLFDEPAGVDLPARARRFGYVFQDYALFPHLDVAANIAYGLRGRSPQEARARVAEVTDLLGIGELLARRPAQLSGGQRQRVALARALAIEPAALLLDEPFAALDAPVRAELVARFLELQGRTGVPTVLVTHDAAEAYLLAREVVVLEAGRVLAAGPREQVFGAPPSPAAARLVGVGNLLEGRVVHVEGARAQVEAGGLTTTVGAARLTPGQPVTLGVRAAGLEAAPAEGDAGANATLAQDLRAGLRGGPVALRLDAGPTLTVDLGAGSVPWAGPALPIRWRVAVRPGAALAWAQAAPATGVGASESASSAYPSAE
jgi:molybdate transport system ATP-binding protein